MSAGRWAWMALALCGALLFGSAVQHALGDMGGDSATYVLLGQSIATGQGYRDLTDPLERPHTKYPPLFPLLLAPLVALCGAQAFWPMHAFVAATALAAVLLAVALGRALRDGWGAWVMGWGTLLHPLVVGSAVCLWTEFPYLAWSLLALIGWQRADEKDAGRRWWWLAAAGTAAAMLTRAVGVTLWPVRTARAAARASRSQWLGLIAAVLPWVAWMIRNALVRDAAAAAHGYVRELWLVNPYHPEQGTLTAVGWLSRLVDGAHVYLSMIGRLLGGAWPVAWCAVALVMMIGVAVCWSRRRSVADWYAAWYLLALLPHPWREERLVLPLLPLAWRYLWIGGSWCVERVPRRAWSSAIRLTMAGALALLLADHGIAAAQTAARQYRLQRALSRVTVPDAGWYSVAWALLQGRPQVADYLELLLWIRAQPLERVVVISRKPSITTLLAGQPSVYYPFTTDEAAWRQVLAQPAPVLLIADQWAGDTRQFVWPIVERHPDWFTPVHAAGTCLLFRYRVPVPGTGTGY